MAGGELQLYFQRRADRFSAFYSSEPVSRVLGRGPLFDRLRMAVDAAVELGAKRVLDVGCGSGPLFAPLAEKGIHVTGVDPTPNMVAKARTQAETYPGLIDVVQGRWEDIDDVDGYDLAVALGVFDHVPSPVALLRRMGRASPHVVGSFPASGMRTALRKVRHAGGGVGVYGYTDAGLARAAAEAGLHISRREPLGRVGWVVHFERVAP